MGSKESCSSCKDWIPQDRSLDGGRVLIGTCNAKKDYHQIVSSVKRKHSFQDDPTVEELKRVFKQEEALIQLNGCECGARAFERTSANHYCSKWSSNVPVKQPSLTATGAAK